MKAQAAVSKARKDTSGVRSKKASVKRTTGASENKGESRNRFMKQAERAIEKAEGSRLKKRTQKANKEGPVRRAKGTSLKAERTQKKKNLELDDTRDNSLPW